jgi:hypothetical protein
MLKMFVLILPPKKVFLFMNGFQIAFCSSHKAKSNIKKNVRFCQLYFEADFLFQKCAEFVYFCAELTYMTNTCPNSLVCV